MNGWGIPDWTDPAAYGDTEEWSQKRWRWEFTRRREDFRADFDAILDYTVEHYREVHSLAEDRGRERARLLEPHEPGFSCVTTTDQFVKYGVSLFNPRISEQAMWRLNFQPNPFRTGAVTGDGEPFEGVDMSIPDGSVGIRIDLDRPIATQLDGWRSYLQYLQTKRHGKKVQRRQRPEMWFKYLRVLDAREAGASWAAIFEAVLSEGKSRNLNPAQEARGVWESARHLMFNWPS